MLFDRVDVAELLARDAFAKGAYMLGAEDREIKEDIESLCDHTYQIQSGQIIAE